MEWDTLFGPAATGALAAITELLPVVIPVFVALVGIGVAIKVFAKFGIRR